MVLFCFLAVCSQVSGQEGAVACRPWAVQEAAVRHLVPPLPPGQKWRVSLTLTAGGAAATRKEEEVMTSKRVWHE